MGNQSPSSVIPGIMMMNCAFFSLTPNAAPSSVSSVRTAVVLEAFPNNSSVMEIGRFTNHGEMPDSDQPETITSLAAARRRFLSSHFEGDVPNALPTISLREG